MIHMCNGSMRYVVARLAGNAKMHAGNNNNKEKSIKKTEKTAAGFFSVLLEPHVFG